MDRYTAYETKRTTAANSRSVWSGLTPPARAPALHDGSDPSPHTRSSLAANTLPSVSSRVGLVAASDSRSSTSARSKYPSASRCPTAASYRRSVDDTGTSRRSRSSGRRDIAGYYSASNGELPRSDAGGKTNEAGQVHSPRRHPTQGESGRFPALFSTTRSKSES